MSGPRRIPLSSIIEGTRYRIEYHDLDTLRESLDELGQIQALCVAETSEPDKYLLVAGGRRYRAMTRVTERFPEPWTECNVTVRPPISEADLRMLEFEENERRSDMTWQEKTMLFMTMIRADRKEKRAKHQKWTQQQAGDLFKCSRTHVANILVVGELLEKGDREIMEMDTFDGALRKLLERKNDEASQALLRKLQVEQESIKDRVQVTDAPSAERIEIVEVDGERRAVATTEPAPVLLDIDYRLGDSIHSIMPSMSRGSVDHIFTDIPYGIDMDHLNIDGIDEVKDEHDVEENKSLMEPFLEEAYRVLPKQGFCVFFYDLDHHQYLQDVARRIGFSVQRWPLVWKKTSACKNEAPAWNTTKDYEVIMVLRKGAATIKAPVSSSLLLGGLTSEERAYFKHAFSKPRSICTCLLSMFASPGQTILDPYAGELSMAFSVQAFGCKSIAIEKKPLHYERGLAHITNGPPKFKT